jgi:hypothetical protein
MRAQSAIALGRILGWITWISGSTQKVVDNVRGSREYIPEVQGHVHLKVTSDRFAANQTPGSSPGVRRSFA